MMRFIEAGRLRRLGVALLASMLASRSVDTRAQDVTPSIAGVARRTAGRRSGRG